MINLFMTKSILNCFSITPYYRPANTTRVGSTKIDTVRLLCWTYPDGPIFWFKLSDDSLNYHIDILVKDVHDESGVRCIAKFSVYSLIGPVHITISKSNVSNGICSNGSNGQSYSTGIKALKYHILSPFHCNTVILRPDRGIVYPDIGSTHIYSIRVESC